MTALLNFDCEFTFPVPKLGSLLQIGFVVHGFDEETLGCSMPLETHQAYFKIPNDVVISDWVKENQADLLEKCQELTYEEDTKAKQGVLDFLTAQKKKHGKLIPAGYVLGSDMAYLFDFLGRDHELVHYAGLDLKGMGLAMSGRYSFSDEDVADLFKISPNQVPHHALHDAMYQAKVMISFLKMIQKQAHPI